MTAHHEHRPPHDRQLEDALFSTRRALSALKAIDVATLPAAEHERLSRVAGVLADAAEELAR